MTTVFLSEWEWACCGDPFAVGDHVEFGAVEMPRELRELCAPAASPDFAETHHDDEPPFPVSGIVRAGSALFVDHRTIRVPRQGPTGADVRLEGYLVTVDED